MVTRTKPPSTRRRRGWFAALLGALLSASCSKPPAPPPTAELRQTLHQQAARWVAGGELARRDGFTYAVDVGQLLVHAARSGDRAMYESVRTAAMRFMVDDPGDDLTRGFVVWRDKPGTPHDASGTTEALRFAQGFWEGATAFGVAEDRARAVTILRGYTRHAGVDQGVWLIRNYFNFATRGFATNSFLVDYDPDLLREVGSATGDTALLEAAERSYALVSNAAAPCGLVYDVVQPELLTLMPDFHQAAFSPNDVVQLSNSGTVAERCVARAPEVALRVLRFASARSARLNTSYLGRSGAAADDGWGGAKPGDPAQPHPAGLEAYAVLVRLAARLDDRRALSVFLPPLCGRAAAFAENPCEPRLYTAGEILLALDAAAGVEGKRGSAR